VRALPVGGVGCAIASTWLVLCLPALGARLGLPALVAPDVVRAQDAAPQATFKSGIELVNLGVAVIDKMGGAVNDLRLEDFEVTEAGRKQEIRYFVRGDTIEAGERPPLHIGLVFDTSGSMAADMDLARSAAIKFLNRLPRAEDMTIVDFDTEVRIATYGQSDFSRLVSRLRGRKPDGWTALFDAVGVYLGGAMNQTGQKVLVIYTDGGDTRSSMTYADLISTLKACDVTVYTIGFLENQSHASRTEQRLHLQQMADVTGGQAYFPQSIKEVDKIYDRVVTELDNRYLLGYVSTDVRADGGWRPVEVRLRRPDLRGVKIRARKGYYAPYKAEATPAARKDGRSQ
jgi:Ca-activated chloride channel family protein